MGSEMCIRDSSNKCAFTTRSALLKNFNARASSKNPKLTFTLFNQPPLDGIEFNQDGKMANKVNGKAMAKENPNIPQNGPMPPFFAACTSKVPTIGPVHENETRASVKAMKKIPTSPPLSAPLSAAFTHLLGNTISNAPRKDAAKTTSMRKKKILKITLVLSALSESLPKIAVTTKPKET